MKTIFIITILMSITGYIVTKLGQKHAMLFAMLIPIMICIDAFIIYTQYIHIPFQSAPDNHNIMTGVMLGTLTKIIIFLNYESN